MSNRANGPETAFAENESRAADKISNGTQPDFAGLSIHLAGMDDRANCLSNVILSSEFQNYWGLM